jgi:metacaspase-1
MAAFGAGHALVVGVGQYANPKLSVSVTTADARGIAAALQSADIAAYPQQQVRLLCDQEATRAGLIGALEKLATQVGEQDTVLIFFAGHGARADDNQYSFGTHDVVLQGTLFKAKTGLSQVELLEHLRAIKAKKLLMILNTCFSGAVAPSLDSQAAAAETGGDDAGSLGAPPTSTFNASILATGEGRAIITAGRTSQKSYFLKNQQRTFFGQALIDGLSGQGIATNSPYVGLFELYNLVYERVKQQAAQLQLAQEPVLTLLQGVGPFPVAHYQGGTTSSLGADAILKDAPENKALEVVDQRTAHTAAGMAAMAAGKEAKAWNFNAGGSITVDESRSLFRFGNNVTVGNITTGDIAWGDLVKINVSAANASQADTKEQLLELIAELRGELKNLQDAPKSKRVDAEFNLSQAEAAIEENDKPTLFERLENAQKILLALGSSLPAAIKLGEAVGAALQRAMSLF